MASLYWVGGDGAWDGSNVTNWATSSGGATHPGSPPGSADTAYFDANSGSGTGAGGGPKVTVNTTVNVASINANALAGTLDFSVNNNNVTSGFFLSNGSSVRTINLGSGTFTLNGVGIVLDFSAIATNLTLSAGSSTITIPPVSAPTNDITLNTGGVTLGTVNLGAMSNTYRRMSIAGSAAPTIGTLNISSPNKVLFPTLGSTTGITITNAFSWNGTSSNPLLLSSNYTGGSFVRISVAAAGSTISWAALEGIQFITNTVTATNSFDVGGNSGVTITPPSTGGGAGVIGG